VPAIDAVYRADGSVVIMEVDAHFGQRDHPDRAIVIVSIGAS
jgi:hypothetical protein